MWILDSKAITLRKNQDDGYDNDDDEISHHYNKQKEKKNDSIYCKDNKMNLSYTKVLDY